MKAIVHSLSAIAMAVSIPGTCVGRQVTPQIAPASALSAEFVPDLRTALLSRPAFTLQRRDEAQGSLALTIGATILVGGIGAALGASAGYALDSRTGDCHDWCGLVGFVFGGSIGIALGTATGAHIGNGGRGDWGSDVLGGVLGVAAGFGWMALTGYDTAVANFFVPVPMIVLPVVFERMSARKRFRQRQLSAQIGPTPGGLAFGFTTRF